MNKKLFPLFLVVVWIGVLLCASASRAGEGAPSVRALQDAQRRWDQVTFYRFSATLEQEQVPAATLTNVGRSGRLQRFYLEGQAWPAEGRMEAGLWTQGGDLLTGEGKLDLRVENGHTWIRAAGEDWQPLDDFSSAFAPEGDWLALLTAAIAAPTKRKSSPSTPTI